MKPFSASEVAKIVNGTITNGPEGLIVTDSTAYVEMLDKPHMLLFLRRTWRVNWEVIKKCTPCIVVTDEEFKELMEIENCAVISVMDINTAYWKFAEYYRSLFDIPVIAVTGTCGKSTTKDMIKHILSDQHKVTGTFRSANGRTMHFGYLVRIDESIEAAVFETPVGEPGDLTDCCKYFKPTIGIITNIGVDHLAGCKSPEKYIEAKAELVSGLPYNGVLILNADDANIKKINLKHFNGRVVYFGIENPCKFKAYDISYCEEGMEFKLTFQKMKYSAFIPGYGTHQVYNALAAIAAVHEMGIGIGEAIERIKTFENLPLHLKVCKGINNSQIIKDTWSINPSSLKAALEVLNHLSKGKKRIALIGDIDELGEWSLDIHHQVGGMLAQMNVLDILITVGPMASIAARTASEEGFKGDIFTFEDIEGVHELLSRILDKNTILLIKSAGSRDPGILNLDLV